MVKAAAFLTALVLMLGITPALAQDEISTERYVFLLGINPFAFEYPTDWSAQEAAGSVLLSNNPENLTNTQSTQLRSTDDYYVLVAVDAILYFAWDVYEPAEKLEDMVDIASSNLAFNPPNDWEFGDAEYLTLESGDNAAIVMTGEQDGWVAFYVLVEHTAGQYVLFFGSTGIDNFDTLQQILLHGATSLLVGDEVPLEDAQIIQNSTFEYETPVYNLAIGADHFYTVEYCRTCIPNLVTYSLEGEMLNRLENESMSLILDLIVNTDGTFWAMTRKDDGNFALSLLSADGEPVVVLDLDASAIAPRFDVGIDGNLYVTVTRELEVNPTQPPGEVPRTPTEDWVQVWSPDGELLREFMVNSQEYTLRPGVNQLSVGTEGNIYIVDSDTNVGILVFDAEGNVIDEGVGRSAVMFQQIQSFEVLSDGTIFMGVTTGGFSEMTTALIHMAKTGELLGIFTAESLGIEELAIPTDVYMTDHNSVLILSGGLTSTQVLELAITAPESD